MYNQETGTGYLTLLTAWQDSRQGSTEHCMKKHYMQGEETYLMCDEYAGQWVGSVWGHLRQKLCPEPLAEHLSCQQMSWACLLSALRLFIKLATSNIKSAAWTAYSKMCGPNLHVQ